MNPAGKTGWLMKQFDDPGVSKLRIAGAQDWTLRSGEFFVNDDGGSLRGPGGSGVPGIRDERNLAGTCGLNAGYADDFRVCAFRFQAGSELSCNVLELHEKS